MIWISAASVLFGYMYLVNKLGPEPQTTKYRIFAFLGAFPVVIFAFIFGAIIQVSIMESPSLHRWDAERLTSQGVETNYYKDDGEIFYRSLSGTGFVEPKDIVLRNADLASFEILHLKILHPVRGGEWARDANSVYYQYFKTDFDPKSFTIISTNINNRVEYISDKSGVYYHKYATSTIFVTKEVEGFKIIEDHEGYWTDGHAVFDRGLEVEIE